jgi:hypothetical protein
VRALDGVLGGRNWNRDGSARNAGQLLAGVQDDLVVSVARDLAQSAVAAAGPAGMPRTAKLTSDAEHLLLSGRPDQAVSLLAQAYRRAR